MYFRGREQMNFALQDRQKLCPVCGKVFLISKYQSTKKRCSKCSHSRYENKYSQEKDSKA